MATNDIVIGEYSRMSYDDMWHRIGLNDRMHYLSPTQYRLFRAFVSTSTPISVSGTMMILAYRSRQELLGEMELSHSLLIKHVSNLNTKIGAIGFQVCPFRTGYILTFTSMSTKNL